MGRVFLVLLGAALMGCVGEADSDMYPPDTGFTLDADASALLPDVESGEGDADGLGGSADTVLEDLDAESDSMVPDGSLEDAFVEEVSSEDTTVPDIIGSDMGGWDAEDDASEVGEDAIDPPLTPDSLVSDSVSDVPDIGEPVETNCEGLPVCEDFESSVVGSAPDPAHWEVVSPNCSGDGTIVVDDAVSHSGSQSIRVESSGGYCNHVFASPIGSIGPVDQALHGRFYMRFGTALDMAHITFLAMKDQVDDKDLRMGGQNEILMWNRELGDATLPELSPTGVSMSVKPPVNEWICIEFMVDGIAGTLSTWMNGILIEGLVIDGEPTQDVDNQWLNMAWNPELIDARFGWESYGGVPMTLWYDDIVLSPYPIGCND
jgi:hypothetical protein